MCKVPVIILQQIKGQFQSVSLEISSKTIFSVRCNKQENTFSRVSLEISITNHNFGPLHSLFVATNKRTLLIGQCRNLFQKLYFRPVAQSARCNNQQSTLSWSVQKIWLKTTFSARCTVCPLQQTRGHFQSVSVEISFKNYNFGPLHSLPVATINRALLVGQFGKFG